MQDCEQAAQAPQTSTLLAQVGTRGKVRSVRRLERPNSAQRQKKRRNRNMQLKRQSRPLFIVPKSGPPKSSGAKSVRVPQKALEPSAFGPGDHLPADMAFSRMHNETYGYRRAINGERIPIRAAEGQSFVRADGRVMLIELATRRVVRVFPR